MNWDNIPLIFVSISKSEELETPRIQRIHNLWIRVYYFLCDLFLFCHFDAPTNLFLGSAPQKN